jgi:hypothetical protein
MKREYEVTIKQKSILQSLGTKFTRLSYEEQVYLKGGDWMDDWFNQIFDLSLLPPTSIGQNGTVYDNFHNIQVLNDFKDAFKEIASTSMGKTYLESIKNKNEKIILSPDNPTANNASADYDYSTNTLRIGKFDAFSFKPELTNVVAHEIFHAYADIIEGGLHDGGDVRQEINAQILAATVARQYDKNHNITSNDPQVSRYAAFLTFTPNDVVFSSDNWGELRNGIFKNAWDEIILHGNFNQSNYDTLVNFFYSGSTYGTQYQSQGLTKTTKDISQNVFIDDFFNLYFKDSYTDFNSANNGNGNTSNSSDPNSGSGPEPYVDNSGGISPFWFNVLWAAATNQLGTNWYINSGSNSSGGSDWWDPVHMGSYYN